MIKCDGSPIRCLFSIKPFNIQHEQYAQCVMQTIRQILLHTVGKLDDCAIDMKELDGTNYCSLNYYLTDESVKTIIYYYFYTKYLTYQNVDPRSQKYALPRLLTNDFANDNNHIASNFFAPVLGNYSETAKLFGYSDPISSKSIHYHTFSYIDDYDLHDGYESI